MAEGGFRKWWSVPCFLAALLTAAPVPAAPAAPLAVPQDRWPQLTDRQREIVHWASQGLSNKQIGRRLGISPETVKTHLHHVFEREGISGRMALVAAHRSEAAGAIA